jgi:integrase
LHKAFFSTLYLTGCRKGEAYALTWSDFNQENKTLIINKTLSSKTITHDRTFSHYIAKVKKPHHCLTR